MNNYRPYKFLVVSVIQEVDDEGQVVQELTTEKPTAVFGLRGLHEYADNFERELADRIPEHE